MATRGIDIRQTSDRIVFRASLKDSAGAKVTSGTTELRVYRLEDDGTLDVLDWDSGVKDFVASGATDDEVTMTHRQSNGTDDTGIWTYVLSDATLLAAFDSGQVYIAQVTNSGAAPESQEREFQFGGVEGNQAADTSVGTGARTVTVTVNDGSDPLENATVRLTEGVNTFTALTNASGVASFGSIADATYTVAISKAGYSYAGTSLVVDGDETPTYSMTAITVTPSADPAKTTGYARVYDETLTAESGVSIKVRMIAKPESGGGRIFDAASQTVTSDASGDIEVTLLKGATYEISRPNRQPFAVRIAADAGSTTQLPDIL